jgi:hypothetical protein
VIEVASVNSGRIYPETKSYDQFPSDQYVTKQQHVTHTRWLEMGNTGKLDFSSVAATFEKAKLTFCPAQAH